MLSLRWLNEPFTHGVRHRCLPAGAFGFYRCVVTLPLNWIEIYYRVGRMWPREECCVHVCVRLCGGRIYFNKVRRFWFWWRSLCCMHVYIIHSTRQHSSLIAATTTTMTTATEFGNKLGAKGFICHIRYGRCVARGNEKLWWMVEQSVWIWGF